MVFEVGVVLIFKDAFFNENFLYETLETDTLLTWFFHCWFGRLRILKTTSAFIC